MIGVPNVDVNNASTLKTMIHGCLRDIIRWFTLGHFSNYYASLSCYLPQNEYCSEAKQDDEDNFVTLQPAN